MVPISCFKRSFCKADVGLFRDVLICYGGLVNNPFGLAFPF